LYKNVLLNFQTAVPSDKKKKEEAGNAASLLITLPYEYPLKPSALEDLSSSVRHCETTV